MYMPISQNDRDKVKKLMAQGATEDEAWDLVSDDYEEMDDDNLAENHEEVDL